MQPLWLEQHRLTDYYRKENILQAEIFHHFTAMLAAIPTIFIFVCLIGYDLHPVTAVGVITTGTLTGASFATLGVGVSSTTAAAATAAAAAAGVGTAAVVGALAATALARRRRFRRDAKDLTPQSCFGLENVELMYVLAANTDQLGCGQRLVCELEATPDSELSETELQILQLFGREIHPLKTSEMFNPKATYHYAAQVGSKASSAADCAEVFDMCPLDRSTIMGTYARYAETTPADDDGALQIQ